MLVCGTGDVTPAISVVHSWKSIVGRLVLQTAGTRRSLGLNEKRKRYVIPAFSYGRWCRTFTQVRRDVKIFDRPRFPDIDDPRPEGRWNDARTIKGGRNQATYAAYDNLPRPPWTQKTGPRAGAMDGDMVDNRGEMVVAQREVIHSAFAQVILGVHRLGRSNSGQCKSRYPSRCVMGHVYQCSPGRPLSMASIRVFAGELQGRNERGKGSRFKTGMWRPPCQPWGSRDEILYER